MLVTLLGVTISLLVSIFGILNALPFGGEPAAQPTVVPVVEVAAPAATATPQPTIPAVATAVAVATPVATDEPVARVAAAPPPAAPPVFAAPVVAAPPAVSVPPVISAPPAAAQPPAAPSPTAAQPPAAPSPTPRLYPTNAEVGIIRPARTPTPVPYVGQSLGPAVPDRIARWEKEITAAAERYELDPNLIAALMNTESTGNPAAVSRANAIGLLQVIDGPRDPAQNVMLGAKMLAHNLRLFDEDLELALAAYNAGPRNVLRYKGIPPFAETKAHIERTVSAYERYRRAA